MQYCSIGELSLVLGVAVSTLRRWDREGRISPDGRTPGGHRRYRVDRVLKQLGLRPSDARRKTLAYARVSSHDQKPQMETQARRLEQHCKARGYAHVEVICDLGSGMNYSKRGLKKLLRLVLAGEVERLVLVTKDRLLRFGAELLFGVCAFMGVEVEVLDAQPDISREQQLTEDLIEILTVFSSRLYGARGRKNQRALAEIA